MTRLILIRHGQSEANEQNRFAGQTNVPLTELGKIQAKSAAEYITKREKIDKIYSSDLQSGFAHLPRFVRDELR